MKQVSLWFKKLAITTTLSLTWINTLAVESVRANTSAKLNSTESIEIYVPAPETQVKGICSSFIEPIINRIVARPSFQGTKWGILIQSLDGTTLYSYHPDSYLIPASNMKLLVTAAALQKLNPEGTIHSKSIQDWIMVTNLNSNNYYADTLLSYLGGSQSVREALTSLGIDPNSYRIADGSGLSRSNLVTPRGLTSILRAMYSARGKDIFLTSLPVAGVSGTLKHRLSHTLAEGNVHAKTGTLRGVRTLSGYLEHPEYGTIIFSTMANQPLNQGDDVLVKAIDEIIERLSSITSCT
jgi:D-alanyl-D-alanine carboxypeptidase/D-alanyl-D-alanine-endopeptidase (penicillin-binding protein 4)